MSKHSLTSQVVSETSLSSQSFTLVPTTGPQQPRDKTQKENKITEQKMILTKNTKRSKEHWDKTKSG